MIGILAGRCNAIVTTGAGAQYLEVINRHRRIPDVGTVAVLADVGGADVIKRLPGRSHAIVATATGFSGGGMIKSRRQPGIGRVAVITLSRGRQMIRILAFGGDTVMTTRTSTQHLEVIHCHRRNPCGVVVAVFANVGRTDMLETLAGRRHAIVTAATGFSGRGMIKARGQPGIGRVTVITLCRGCQVINILAHGDDAIMTTGAGAQHLDVIHGHRRFPGVGRVAIFADVCTVDMFQTLASGGDTVMATRARAEHLQVVHLYSRNPNAGRMAILTNIGGADVVEGLAGRGHTIVAVTTTLGGNVLVIKVGR